MSELRIDGLVRLPSRDIPTWINHNINKMKKFNRIIFPNPNLPKIMFENTEEAAEKLARNV